MAKIKGTPDHDFIEGTNAADQIYGLDGSDTISALAGADLVHGNAGDDSIEGGEDADELFGDAGNDDLSGGNGTDTLHGGAQDDYLWGGEDQDFLYGDGGNDTLADSKGGDVLDGGKGIDTVSLSYGSFFSPFHEAVEYDFGSKKGALKTPDGSTLISIEQVNIFGSNFDDTFKGGAFNDTLRGWMGNDEAHGGAGDDFLIGDNGNDVLYGDAGNDLITGNGNSDTLIGGAGNDTLIGGRTFDVFTGDDVMEGGEGADTFLSGPGRTDLIYSNSTQGVYVDMELRRGFGGEAQGDTFEGPFRGKIYGSAFADYFVGGEEQLGQGGDDLLMAGLDTLFMTGGAGKDTFAFRYPGYMNSPVHITDFLQVQDEILDVSGIDARATLRGDQVFKFIGTEAFSKAGQLRYEVQDGNTVVQMDVSGDGAVDLSFVLNGVYALEASDFIL